MWTDSMIRTIVFTYLDLVDVDDLEFFLHFFGPHLHGVDGGFGVLQRLCDVVSLLHVECLDKEKQTYIEV